MSATIQPFSLQLPVGYSLSTANSGTQGATATATQTSSGAAAANTASTAPPADVVSISNTYVAGSFTADAGDTYRLSDLFHSSMSAGQAIAGYRVAVGSGVGRLMLGTQDVTSQINFTAAQFAALSYVTGGIGDTQNLTVVAQLGTPQKDGSLTQEIDSPAVQITANVTGVRSINAMNALSTPLPATDPDAATVGVVKQAGILVGWTGASRPTLQSDGNFTTEAANAYRMSDLFTGGAPTGQTLADYRVALGDGGGKLLLGSQDVTDQINFTAAQFAQLTYVSGAIGEAQSLTVVAQLGTPQSDGSLTHEVDSQAMQITAKVTGSRSINAMNALSTKVAGTDPDAAAVDVAKQAGILGGWTGAPRPTLRTDGNFTANAADTYRMSDLFQASAPSGQSIAGYRVALSGSGGKLMLGSQDVTNQVNFTADEFANLSYLAGGIGDSQSLTVAAQLGTRQSDNTLTREIDSQAVQITASVTGSRSINAMNALSTTLSGTDPDAATVDIAKQAGILAGWTGAPRPTLQTDGNFTAKAADTYRMSDLFHASAATGQTIAGYRVAVDGTGGKLMLGTKDVTDQLNFTANEFAQLSYVAGNINDAQSLTVVAQLGTRQSDNSLTREIDSPAVQIIANVTGVRSINAMDALSTILSDTDPDAATVSVAKQAGILAGWTGASRPTMRTDGNFTANAGDTYRVNDLFHGNASAGQTIAGYHIALDGTGGKLMLDGKDVTTQMGFTAAEFANLTYVAGSIGDVQRITAIAQLGTLLKDGTLSGEIDSPAVQIVASITGTRSINAVNALSTSLSETDPDVASVSIAKQAGILTGWTGASRPSLQTALQPDPSLPIEDLQDGNGAYRSAGDGASSSEIDLSSFYASATGSAFSPASFVTPGESLAMALLLLNPDATGAFQTTGDLARQVQAISAYLTTGKR